MADGPAVPSCHRRPRPHRRSADRAPSRPALRFGGHHSVSTVGMDLKRPLLVLAVASSLVACGGDNTNLQRGETNCDSASQNASNPHDATCSETGTPADNNGK